MKGLITVLLLSCCAGIVFAGKVTGPERIYPLSVVTYPASYYTGQAQLWEQEVQQFSSNAAAWLNYYLAAKTANQLTGYTLFQVSEIAKEAYVHIPETYEALVLRFLQSPREKPDYDYLLQAYRMSPERTEAYPELLPYFKRTFDGRATDVCQRWSESGLLSQGLMTWNYNLLMSLEEHAILITGGENDTYPAWILQEAKGIRKDILILPLALARDKTYNNEILQLIRTPPMADNAFESVDFEKQLIIHLNKPLTRPVYLSVGTPAAMREGIEKNLFLTGLAFRYSLFPFDNMTFLKYNFENKFLKDQFKIAFAPDISASLVNEMNLNYVPAFKMLNEYYRQKGDQLHINETFEITQHILSQVDSPHMLSLNNTQQSTPAPIVSVINIKSLEKSMKPVSNNLWASEVELTIGDYQQFLMDLVKNRQYDLLETCKMLPTDWVSYLPEPLRNLPTDSLYKHAHPDSDECPVQNISYEAAVKYCEWITKVYNDNPGRKKFKKVIFRLPDIKEWEAAARGKWPEGTLYPWNGLYVRNSRGCYLGNYNVSMDKPCEDCTGGADGSGNDGGFFTVMTGSYFPNDIGLYNVSGNVAEMVSTKGIAKGGSWMQLPFESQIPNQTKYEGPSPGIGFRVFMEVIE